MQRIQRSIALHAAFVTHRRGEGCWLLAGEGVRIKILYNSASEVARLAALAPGAQWVGPEEGVDEECIVISGALRMGPHRLTAQAYALHPNRFGDPVVALDEGATLFSRQVVTTQIDSLPNAESAWWGRGRQPEVVGAPQDASAWQHFAPGIRLRVLRGRGEVMSMLVRFAPGARLPAHRHALGEHCLMLEGDLFLGDTLLRNGEYQWAPAGSEHGELMSDVGCLLFFHGGVDSSLRG